MTGNSAFPSCSALSKVVLINGLMTLGVDMFNMYNSGGLGSTLLSTITIPSTITYIGNHSNYNPNYNILILQVLLLLAIVRHSVVYTGWEVYFLPQVPFFLTLLVRLLVHT